MNDKARYMDLQTEYKAGNKSALNDMYQMLYTMAHKMINAQTNKNPKLQALSKQERQSKAHDAATAVIEKYLTDPTFEIKKNVASYLYLWVMTQLYYMRHCDLLLARAEALPETKPAGKKYYYLVTYPDGTTKTFDTAKELRETFKKISLQRLTACFCTGKSWHGIRFDLIEL